MNKLPFLLEIATADLPAKILPQLANAIKSNLLNKLDAHNISYKQVDLLYTPRRITILVHDLAEYIPEQEISKQGPPLKYAFNMGKPTKAAIGFASSFDVSVEALTVDDAKQCLSYIFVQPSKLVAKILPEILAEVIQQPDNLAGMRWGSSQQVFSRPITGLLVMLGSQVLQVQAFGFTANNITKGHRSKGNQDILVHDPKSYVSQLLEQQVIVSQAKRLQIIKDAIEQIEQKHQVKAIYTPELLVEISNLVEYPVVLLGSIDKQYLSLPTEVLTTTMIHHQKCLPLLQADKAYPGFIMVSNVAGNLPNIIQGNERVMAARLYDAWFFYEQDCKRSIESYLADLKQITLHPKLGNMHQQALRLSKLMSLLVDNNQHAKRAGMLAKFDLATNMVYEFPELQAIMGYHYALALGEDDAIALAIKEQYLGLDGDMPTTHIGAMLALAYRLDHLVGYFGIGLIAKGDSDPFALRRAAIIVVQIILQQRVNLDLTTLIQKSMGLYDLDLQDNTAKLFSYIIDRLAQILADAGVASSTFLAISSLPIKDVCLIHDRALELHAYLQQGKLVELMAMHKRVNNILRNQTITDINHSLLLVKVEEVLVATLAKVKPEVSTALAANDYTKALTSLCSLAKPLTNFFAEVMVLSEDLKLRQNRLNILADIHSTCLQVADFSKIQL